MHAGAGTHTVIYEKKSHVHGSCDDDDRHTRCCASCQRPARRERPTGVHGHAYKWRERGGGVGGGDGEELRSMSALPTGAAGRTHRKQEHASRWATKNAAGARLRRETLCVNGCADAKQGRRLRTGARTGPRRRGSRERGRHEAMEGRERAGVPKGRTAGGRKLKAQGQRRCGGRRRATGAVPRSNLRAASIEGVEEGRTGRTGRLRRRATASGRRGRRPRAGTRRRS